MRSPTLWDTISPSLSFVALGMKKGGVWTAWLRGGQLSLGIIYEARTRFWDDTEWEWRFRLRIYLSIYLSNHPFIYRCVLSYFSIAFGFSPAHRFLVLLHVTWWQATVSLFSFYRSKKFSFWLPPLVLAVYIPLFWSAAFLGPESSLKWPK